MAINSESTKRKRGRPKKAKPSVPAPSDAVDWAAVERFANVGAGEDEIVTGLGITEAQMKDPATADGKKKISSSLLPLIAEMADEIEKSHWIGQLSRKLGVPEDAIRADLGRKVHAPGAARRAEGREGAPEMAHPRGRRAMLEDRLVALLAAYADKAVLVEDRALAFTTEANARIYGILTGKDHSAAPDGAPYSAA